MLNWRNQCTRFPFLLFVNSEQHTGIDVNLKAHLDFLGFPCEKVRMGSKGHATNWFCYILMLIGPQWRLIPRLFSWFWLAFLPLTGLPWYSSMLGSSVWTRKSLHTMRRRNWKLNPGSQGMNLTQQCQQMDQWPGNWLASNWAWWIRLKRRRSSL